MDLFFFLILSILFGMIVGMIFVSILFVPQMQSFILSIMLLMNCTKGSRQLKPLIQKNLEAHAPRNTKTSLMLTIAVAFLIFSGSTLNQI